MFGRPRERALGRKQLGRIAEEQAARYLAARGYRILARNFRAADGEVDIVADRRGTIAFVEVKARTSDEVLQPRDSVTGRKRGRIARAAAVFLGTRVRREVPTRYDVVEVLLTPDGRVQRTTHLEGAFQPQG